VWGGVEKSIIYMFIVYIICHSYNFNVFESYLKNYTASFLIIWSRGPIKIYFRIESQHYFRIEPQEYFKIEPQPHTQSGLSGARLGVAQSEIYRVPPGPQKKRHLAVERFALKSFSYSNINKKL
jgi:hypothetical protein